MKREIVLEDETVWALAALEAWMVAGMARACTRSCARTLHGPPRSGGRASCTNRQLLCLILVMPTEVRK